MRRSRAAALALALALALPVGAPAAARAQAPLPIDTLALRAHTRFLSDDLLEGRGAGTPGERLAALYLVSQLTELGIPGAAADGGYLQPVPLKEAVIDTARTRLRLAVRAADGTAGADTTFGTPDAFIPNTGGAGAFHSFSGDVVYAGSPATAARALEGVDLRGRVVAVEGPLGGAALQLVPDWRARGAAGVLALIRQPDRWDLYVRSRGPSRFYVDAPVDDPIWQPDLPVLLAGPVLSAALLDGAAAPPRDAPGGVAAVARAVDLDRRVDATVSVHVQDRPSANVAAVIPGSDPALRDEYVAFTAHYDHLGVSTPDATGDSIYNGFSDDAAGDAMLLAIGEALRRDPPRRSVLLLFFTGEERGLLGSTYAATRPVVPLDRIVGLVNLDAGAPPAPPVSWRVAGGSASTLGRVARDAAARAGWQATTSDPSPNSDYWPFLLRGVPAVFLIPGDRWEGVDAATHDALFRKWDHYHQPADEWKPDFSFAGLARYADYALRIGLAAANADSPPRSLLAAPGH